MFRRPMKVGSKSLKNTMTHDRLIRIDNGTYCRWITLYPAGHRFIERMTNGSQPKVMNNMEREEIKLALKSGFRCELAEIHDETL